MHVTEDDARLMQLHTHSYLLDERTLAWPLGRHSFPIPLGVGH